MKTLSYPESTLQVGLKYITDFHGDHEDMECYPIYHVGILVWIPPTDRDWEKIKFS